MREVISAAIIHEGKILLVKKRQTWILPGGKPERGESDIRCLQREFREEVKGLGKLINIAFYNSFTGKTPHTGDIIESRVYFADTTKYTDNPQHSREINKVEWVSDFSGYTLAEATSKAINSLKKDNYLK